MGFIDKSDQQILEIAETIWDNFVAASNDMDYSRMSLHFSREMLEAANEEEMEAQWQTNELLSSLLPQREYMGLLRQGDYVSVLWKQHSDKVAGDYLGRLVLGEEENEVKIFGATIS